MPDKPHLCLHSQLPFPYPEQPDMLLYQCRSFSAPQDALHPDSRCFRRLRSQKPFCRGASKAVPFLSHILPPCSCQERASDAPQSPSNHRNPCCRTSPSSVWEFREAVLSKAVPWEYKPSPPQTSLRFRFFCCSLLPRK